MTITETLLKDGPAWFYIGCLITMIWKIIMQIISVVKNNTTAITRLTEIVSHCAKNKSN